MIPEYKPPKDTRPITAEVYALLRTYIEAGCAATAAYLAGGGVNIQLLLGLQPRIHQMALVLYEFVPASLISLEPATAVAPKIGYPLPMSDADRPGWPTFVDRAQLLTALEVVTPAAVKAEIGNLDRPPDAEGRELGLLNANIGGSEWWAIALSAVGILAFLGRRSIPGLVASLLPVGPIRSTALWLFRGLLASGAIVGISALLNKTVDNFAEAGRNAGDAALGVLFIVIVAAGGYGVIRYANRPSRQ